MPPLRRSPDRVLEGAYAVAGLLVVAGLVHLGVQAVAGGPWSGPVSWRKPVTFGLSFGVTLATVTWVSSLTPLTPSRRRALVLAWTVASVVEDVAITAQAWRHQASHFNIDGVVNSAFAFSAAAGGAVFVVSVAVLAVAAGRGRHDLEPGTRFAVRAGVGTLAVGVGLGAAMIALGTAAGRSRTLADAYAASGPLKAAHGMFLHGVLVLVVAARLAERTGWSARQQLRAARTAAGGFVVAAAGAGLLAGGAPGPAPLVAVMVAVTAAGALALTGVGVVTVHRAIGPAAGTVREGERPGG